ncbi:MAG: hexapeptide transferase [Bacteroidetes bacterium]|nr:hexapeptide transferase [Bacteroidota bacterium]
MSAEYKINKIKLFIDIISSSLKYNVSLLEYFQFGFYNKDRTLRSSYAGTGFMYEYQLKMNPKDVRVILDDKNIFTKKYKDFLIHKSYSLEDLKNDENKGKALLSNSAGKFVLKVSDGKCGAQVLVKNCNEYTIKELIHFMEETEYDLAEEYIIQHKSIMAMSPSAVNTIRIFTQLDKANNVEILGCRFRISINSSVDNLAAGNIAAPIDEETGKVSDLGIYSDIMKTDVEIHPITGMRIVGFQIPFWKETLEMVKKAARAYPQNRSIGWDIVITDSGSGLIEGNHDWCKLLWQLPVKKGLKAELTKHI